MRDTAGELANGLHFLRLAQLLLQTPLRRDVAEQTEQQKRFAAQFDPRIGDFKNNFVPVVELVVALTLLRRGIHAETFAILRQHLFPLLGFGVNHGERLSFQFALAQANQLAEGAVDCNNDAVLIGQHHSVGGVFPHGPEEGFGAAQGGLRRVAFGDIAHVQEQGGFAGVFNAAGADLHRHGAPVSAFAFTFHAE